MRDFLVLVGYCSVYAVWVLVPLVPAILIYRLFPTANTDTEWKILGVALKAGGASGFYFAILALAFFKFIDPSLEKLRHLDRPYWEIKAPIKFVDANRKPIIAISSREQLRVQPFSYDVSKTGQWEYLVTLKFMQSDGGVPDHVRLIFPEGEGFIALKERMNDKNTNSYERQIDLRSDPIIEIRPIVAGGQNQPTSAGFSKHLDYSLESNETR